MGDTGKRAEICIVFDCFRFHVCCLIWFRCCYEFVAFFQIDLIVFFSWLYSILIAAHIVANVVKLWVHVAVRLFLRFAAFSITLFVCLFLLLLVARVGMLFDVAVLLFRVPCLIHYRFSFCLLWLAWTVISVRCLRRNGNDTRLCRRQSKSFLILIFRFKWRAK